NLLPYHEAAELGKDGRERESAKGRKREIRTSLWGSQEFLLPGFLASLSSVRCASRFRPFALSRSLRCLFGNAGCRYRVERRRGGSRPMIRCERDAKTGSMVAGSAAGDGGRVCSDGRL